MISLKYGNTNTFFINGLLFDTDMPLTMQSFYRCIKQNGISFNDIHYVVCSHYHPDHMGLVPELIKKGIKLVVLENQTDYIHFSDQILSRQFGNAFSPIDEKQALVLTFAESRDFLAKLGIDGSVLPTASHSNDGIALLLDDGTCFAGDLEPEQFIDGYENNEVLKKDWNVLKEHGARVVYFGHCNMQILQR